VASCTVFALLFFFAIRQVRQHVRNRDGEVVGIPKRQVLICPFPLSEFTSPTTKVQQPTSTSSFVRQDGLLAQNNAAVAGEKAGAVAANVP
jgi:hypothetical protein